MPTPLDEQRDSILAACMEACERGDQTAVERACRDRPDLADQIRAAAQVMAELQAARGAPAVTAARLPDTIARFQVKSELGHGGMGIVYRAHDPALGRDVALKVLPTALAASPRAVERFRREARALAQTHHPHIVTVHDVGATNDGLPFFAMDLVEGMSLALLMRAAAAKAPRALRAEDLLPGRDDRGATLGSASYVDAAVRLIRKVADALDHAHREGITHRDVKPANILVDHAGEPHLVDFGIAREADSAGATSSWTLAAAGTPAYMAPEQITGQGTVGPWTDVYMLGVTLYETLTLRRPFEATTTQQVFQHILDLEPRSPRKLNSLVSRDLETICLAALEKDPSRRYASARALADDLDSVLARRPIRARPPGPFVRLFKLVRRNPWPTALAGAAAVAAVGGVVGQKIQASRNRVLAHRDVDEAKAVLQRGWAKINNPTETTLSEATMYLEQANALLPDELPGALLLREIELMRHRLDVGRVLEDGISRCRELRGRDDHRAWIEAKTRAMLDGLQVYATQVPGDNLLAVLFQSVLEERRLVMQAEPEPASAVARPLDARASADGKGMIAVAGAPQRGRVHLFRYEQLATRGPLREVPVPFPGGPHPDAPPPGAAVLAVERVARDGSAAQAGIRPGDLVVDVGGEGPAAAALPRSLPDGGLSLGVWSEGVSRTVTLRGSGLPGIDVAVTAYPLACAPSNQVGTLSDCAVAVAPGSYLIVVRAEQHEDLRVPVRVERPGQRVVVRADLLAEGTCPPGFVYVAPGEFVAGGGETPRPEQRRWLDGYWIGRGEVTVAEYLQFLQHQDTRKEIARATQMGQTIRVPRGRWGLSDSELRTNYARMWQEREDGSYETGQDLRLPVSSISCEDCDAYCMWLTQLAADKHEPWLFRLPTEDEWEKAARGVDARVFPWGGTFDPGICGATDPIDPALRMLDESPFGVRDMASGLIEWCLGTCEDRAARPWRGGACQFQEASPFRCASSNGGQAWRMDQKDGFRVVAVRRR